MFLAVGQLLSHALGTAVLVGMGWGMAQGSHHSTWLRMSYAMGQYSPYLGVSPCH